MVPLVHLSYVPSVCATLFKVKIGIIMLLTPLETGILTNERALMFYYSKLKSRAVASGFSIPSLTEFPGYAPTEMLKNDEISTVDAGYVHALRILIPVNPTYYGSTSPVWTFAGTIVA